VRSCRCRTPAGSSASIAGAAPEASMMASMAASPDLLPTAVSPGRAAEQGDRVGFPAGIQRGDDVAQPLAAGDPGGVQDTGRPIS
jgi:hypothetical protein